MRNALSNNGIIRNEYTIFSWVLSDLNIFQIMSKAMKTQSNLYKTRIMACTSIRNYLIRKLSLSAKITISIPMTSIASSGSRQCFNTLA